MTSRWWKSLSIVSPRSQAFSLPLSLPWIQLSSENEVNIPWTESRAPAVVWLFPLAAPRAGRIPRHPRAMNLRGMLPRIMTNEGSATSGILTNAKPESALDSSVLLTNQAIALGTPCIGWNKMGSVKQSIVYSLLAPLQIGLRRPEQVYRAPEILRHFHKAV